MSERQRKHREDPERSGPRRDWSSLYRQPDARDGAARPPAQDIGHADAIDDAVAHGVELGYRVIDEYIRQGQRAAERFNRDGYGNGHYDSDAAAGDLQELLERLMRYSARLLPQWLEAAGALAPASEILRDLLREWDTQSRNGASSEGASSDNAKSGQASSTGAAPDGNEQLAIEVVSSRATRVTLNLRAHSARPALLAGGLRAINPEWPPLTEVALVAVDGGGSPVVRIRVPDDQPAGVYTGVLVDAHSGEPCGTLSVRIAAS